MASRIPLSRRPRARHGHGRHLQEPGQPPVRGDRRQGQTLPRSPHRRRLALRLRPPTRRCAGAGGSFRPRSSSPSASTAMACAKCSASTSAPRKPTRSGATLRASRRRRSLRGVKLVISDAHGEGLKAAVAKVLGFSWQRCRVHFMRNALAHANKNGRRVVVSAFIATAFAQGSADAAGKQWR